MAKNNPASNSLRESVSNMSLQEQVARQRITELEKQVASLKGEDDSQTSTPSTIPAYTPQSTINPFRLQPLQPLPQWFHDECSRYGVPPITNNTIPVPSSQYQSPSATNPAVNNQFQHSFSANPAFNSQYQTPSFRNAAVNNQYKPLPTSTIPVVEQTPVPYGIFGDSQHAVGSDSQLTYRRATGITQKRTIEGTHPAAASKKANESNFSNVSRAGASYMETALGAYTKAKTAEEQRQQSSNGVQSLHPQHGGVYGSLSSNPTNTPNEATNESNVSQASPFIPGEAYVETALKGVYLRHDTPEERQLPGTGFPHIYKGDWRYGSGESGQQKKSESEGEKTESLFQGFIDSREETTDSLFQKYNETMGELRPKRNPVAKVLPGEHQASKGPEAYTQPFCDFLTENPTVFHAVSHFEKKLEKAGFVKLSERKTWSLEAGGKYFVSRNGSSMIAFTVGTSYKGGNGVAMIAGHVDALTAKLKPMSTKKNAAGYVQLGVAPYAGALNSTWWDRDLGIGGRVLVKDSKTGKVTTKLVKLGWPIARIPTLAPHFGVGMLGDNNAETEAVPIIGLDNSDIGSVGEDFKNLTLGGEGTFAATQPPKLVRAIAGELSIQDYSSIINWELELYDTQPAQVGGLDKEFIFAGRIDDKLCSWSAIEGLLASSASTETDSKSEDGIIKLVGLFDDEEIGSLLRQGARGNFLPSAIERITEALSDDGVTSANKLAQTYANSFLISADVTHAVNPNFLSKYLEGHAPRLNVGLVVSADSNGHLTTDSVSTALLTRVAEKTGNKLQLFMIRNDSRSGGTVGPMLSSAMGVRSIDAGIPQLSMHSIRATTGSLDPGLGIKMFQGFFDTFEGVDKEFE